MAILQAVWVVVVVAIVAVVVAVVIAVLEAVGGALVAGVKYSGAPIGSRASSSRGWGGIRSAWLSGSRSLHAAKPPSAAPLCACVRW